LEGRDGSRFAHEALGSVWIAEESRQDELQRQRLAQREVRSRDHNTHSTFSDDAIDAVLASDDLTWPEHWHVRDGSSNRVDCTCGSNHGSQERSPGRDAF